MPIPKTAGAIRWEVEWPELTAAAIQRRAADPEADHDRDRDERDVCRVFATEAAALACARRVVDARQTVYGYATVTRQRLEPIEGTPHYDWENVGEPVYVE